MMFKGMPTWVCHNVKSLSFCHSDDRREEESEKR